MHCNFFFPLKMAKCLANVSKWLGLGWVSPALSKVSHSQARPTASWGHSVGLVGEGGAPQWEVLWGKGRCWPPMPGSPPGPSVLRNGNGAGERRQLQPAARITPEHRWENSGALSHRGRLGESSAPWPLLQTLGREAGLHSSGSGAPPPPCGRARGHRGVTSAYPGNVVNVGAFSRFLDIFCLFWKGHCHPNTIQTFFFPVKRHFSFKIWDIVISV